jgi:hypothetical protein
MRVRPFVVSRGGIALFIDHAYSARRAHDIVAAQRKPMLPRYPAPMGRWVVPSSLR